MKKHDIYPVFTTFQQAACSAARAILHHVESSQPARLESDPATWDHGSYGHYGIIYIYIIDL